MAIKQKEMIEMLQFAIDKIKNDPQDDYVVEQKVHRAHQDPNVTAYDCSISFYWKEYKRTKQLEQ